ncbi:hypothetical protein MMC22_010966, partial [Lobaria immixta]|nr:hypothetical protein [Lobaria immixta]
MSADRAAYLREVDIRKEEAQLYVPKIPNDKGESYVKLEEWHQRYRYLRGVQAGADASIAGVGPRVHLAVCVAFEYARDYTEAPVRFDTRNELQKLAVELETRSQMILDGKAVDTYIQAIRGLGPLWERVNVENPQQNYIKGQATSQVMWEVLCKVHGAQEQRRLNFLKPKFFDYK